MKVSHFCAMGILAAGVAGAALFVEACSNGDETDGGADAADGNVTTDGGASDGSTPDGTTGGSTGTTAAPTCDEYCDLVVASCPPSGATPQYATKAQCLAACPALPRGNGGEVSGNSISCRTYHAGVAGQNGQDVVHCPHSGFSGGATCGSRCEAFCQVATSFCKPPQPQPYANLADCVAACGKDGGFADFDPNQGGGEYGAATSTKNNLNCRQSRLWQALADVDGGAAFECARIGRKENTAGGLTPACVD